MDENKIRTEKVETESPPIKTKCDTQPLHEKKTGNRIDKNAEIRPKQISTGGLSFFAAIILTLIISVIVSVATVKVYHDQFAAKIITINMKKYIDSVSQAVIEGKIKKEAFPGILKELDRRVQEDLPPGTIVLLNDVVMTNVEEFKP